MMSAASSSPKFGEEHNFNLKQIFTRKDISNDHGDSAEDFLDQFQQFGFYWIQRATTRADSRTVLDFLKRNLQACETNWSIENTGDYCEDESQLSPASLPVSSNPSFYVSTIVHRKETKALEELLGTTQLQYPDLLEDLVIPGGAWLFLGRNTSNLKDGQRDAKRLKLKKHNSILGRAEHVDEVTHTGTYHLQVAGTKTWFIRPYYDVFPEPFASSLQEQWSDIASSDGRLALCVEEGDIFVLNTKIWYHCTEIPLQSKDGWSISVARDFCFPIPCPFNVEKGDIIFEEDDIPEDLPRVTHDQNPNCALVVVSAEGDDGGGDADQGENSNASDIEEETIALVALVEIKKDELLLCASEQEEEQEFNANETVDPRVVSRDEWDVGQFVLVGTNNIPAEIPRSEAPNCELVNQSGNEIALRSIVRISTGDVFCIAPAEGVEYEEVEVDLTSGELHRHDLPRENK